MAAATESEMGAPEGSGARSLPAVAEISRGIVGIHAERFGRGPTMAKTVWRDEIVVCLLRDVFTRSEQVLIEAGRFDQVRAHRQALEEVVEPLMRETVERVTGSRVLAFLHQVSPEGTASEVFLLDRSATA